MGKGDNGHVPALNEIKFDKATSRPVSGISFAGLESFDRRGFEFSGDRSFYPPPARTTRRPPHLREESVQHSLSVSVIVRPSCQQWCQRPIRLWFAKLARAPFV